jgi:hypothetical protein
MEWGNRSRVADLVEIARVDLPAITGYGVVAMQAGDDDVARTMLQRAHAEALESDCDYLAELADDELNDLEWAPDRPRRD